MALSFQEIVMRLNAFWAARGCIVAEPYDVEVGAGTMVPATFLRVLGPEPWNVAYPQPSRRPADGRYAENPNRYQHYFQYQVILKPPPDDPLGLYLESVSELGLNDREHDIRFVEDNWENPSLGAWGLGWEVWLDGIEITQFTYFQQCGSLDLDPPSVEMTYGLERIAMYLQGVRDFQQIRWNDHVTYGELYRQSEVEHCTYNFEVADTETLRSLFDLYEGEAARVVKAGLIAPGLDLVLKCSHLFNLLDSRGAVGVTQRANYLGRMRPLARKVAAAYVEQREQAGHPLALAWPTAVHHPEAAPGLTCVEVAAERAPFLLEIGVEELPASDLTSAIDQLLRAVGPAAAELGLLVGTASVSGTPRRLAVEIGDVGVIRQESEVLVKGPPAAAAFDSDGRPTRAAKGFARSNDVTVESLTVQESGGREYVFARKRVVARPIVELLSELSRRLIEGLRFARPMYWWKPSTEFSRPIRWIVALWGRTVVPVTVAGARSGRATMPPRGLVQRPVQIGTAQEYRARLGELGIVLDGSERRQAILARGRELASTVGGVLEEDPELLDEVTNLVERPEPILGSFGDDYLQAPSAALVTVMKKHQRYIPIRDAGGALMARFIAVANGPRERPDLVLLGYEEVLRARFADALFFYRQDVKRRLSDFVPDLADITFLEGVGSMLDKVDRLRRLAPAVAGALGSPASEILLDRCSFLAKADLAAALVRELTELQGEMGREYARRSGEDEEVAQAIFEHHLPRFSGDLLPSSELGFVLGVADRLDTFVSGFAVGLEPTGSSDPYGLRRVALGLLHNLIERQNPVSLDRLVRLAAEISPIALGEERVATIRVFLEQRLRVLLQERGHRAEIVESVLASLADRPSYAARTVFELERSLDTPAFQRLMAGIKRADRIVPREFADNLDPDALRDPADRELLSAYRSAAERIEGLAPDQLEELVQALLPLADPIDRFFDDVLVMAEEPAVRRARLALLERIRDLPRRSFDVSRLPAHAR